MTKIADLEELASPDGADMLLIARGSDGKWFNVPWSSVGGGGGTGENNPATVTQPEAEAGTETALRSWSPLRVAQAINALAPSGSETFAIVSGRAVTSAGGTVANAYNLSASNPSAGLYDYTFTSAQPNADYAVVAMPEGSGLSDINLSVTNKTTTGFRIEARTGDNSATVDTLTNNAHSILVIGSTLGNQVGEFSFCQVRNTDSTTNINGTAANIPFGGTNDATDADYTLASDSITVNFEGTVNVQAHISQSGAAARSNVAVWITKNGTKVSGVGQSGYIRAATGHNESSSHISATFTVSDGDVIRVRGEQRSAAGTVTQISGESQVTVERRT